MLFSRLRPVLRAGFLAALVATRVSSALALVGACSRDWFVSTESLLLRLVDMFRSAVVAFAGPGGVIEDFLADFCLGGVFTGEYLLAQI